MRLPVFGDGAKAQILGIGLGLASALWTADRLGLNIVALLFGAVLSWVAWEFLFGLRLAATITKGAVAVGAITGFAFPWAGLAIAALLETLRP